MVASKTYYDEMEGNVLMNEVQVTMDLDYGDKVVIIDVDIKEINTLVYEKKTEVYIEMCQVVAVHSYDLN